MYEFKKVNDLSEIKVGDNITWLSSTNGFSGITFIVTNTNPDTFSFYNKMFPTQRWTHYPIKSAFNGRLRICESMSKEQAVLNKIKYLNTRFQNRKNIEHVPF